MAEPEAKASQGASDEQGATAGIRVRGAILFAVGAVLFAVFVQSLGPGSSLNRRGAGFAGLFTIVPMLAGGLELLTGISIFRLSSKFKEIGFGARCGIAVLGIGGIMALVFGGAALLRGGSARDDPDVKQSVKINRDLNLLESCTHAFRRDTGALPKRAEDLTTKPEGVNGWKGPYVKQLPFDPWGRHYVFAESMGVTFTTLGRDGVVGGEGASADVERRVR